MDRKEKLKKKGFDYFSSFMAWERDIPVYKKVYSNRAREAGYTSIVIFETKRDDDGMYYFEVWTNKLKQNAI